MSKTSKRLDAATAALHNTTYEKKGVEPDKDLILSEDYEIDPPAGVSWRTKLAFKSIVPDLQHQGCLMRCDLPSLEIMFSTLEEYYKLRDALKKFDKEHKGWHEDDKAVSARTHLTNQMNKTADLFIKISGKFGISPADRVKAMEEIHDIDDPLAIVLGE